MLGDVHYLSYSCLFMVAGFVPRGEGKLLAVCTAWGLAPGPCPCCSLILPMLCVCLVPSYPGAWVTMPVFPGSTVPAAETVTESQSSGKVACCRARSIKRIRVELMECGIGRRQSTVWQGV